MVEAAAAIIPRLRSRVCDAHCERSHRGPDNRRRRCHPQQSILIAEREREIARLSRDELAPQEIEKKRVEIAAEASAEQARRTARGEADAILARYNAEAEGIRKVLDSKVAGYRELVAACVDQSHIAPTLLMVEKLPEIVAEQVKAIQNLKIDKITVWDSGRSGKSGGSTSDFLSGLIGSLPPVHELADQAGIKLPGFLGKIAGEGKSPSAPAREE